MTLEEKDRDIEVLIYLYFSNQASITASFWATIKTLCELNTINYNHIVKAVRTLCMEENVPKDKETYYLLGTQLHITVRPLRKMSGIYWQKQKEYAKEFETHTPIVHRTSVDVAMKNSMRKFLAALNDFFGILSYLDNKALSNILS